MNKHPNKKLKKNRKKINVYKEYIAANDISSDEVLYMGDDIPDLLPMKYVGIPVCPADAAEDIKLVSKYISDKNGGQGCVRDVVEQVLRSRNNWLKEDDHLW